MTSSPALATMAGRSASSTANLSCAGKKSACVICGNFHEFFLPHRNLGKLLRTNRTCRNVAAQLSPTTKKSPLSKVDMEEDANAPPHPALSPRGERVG